MSELPVHKLQREAVERLDALLSLPVPLDMDDVHSETFSPWEIFPIYGSYDMTFDVCATDVLREVESGEKNRTDLGAEMFREMLCVMDLCDYGTSPRGCFPTMEFRKRLPALIEKWEEYAKAFWGEGWR